MDINNGLRKAGYNRRWLKLDLSKLRSNGKKLADSTIKNYINKINYLSDELGEYALKFAIRNRDNRRLETFIENRYTTNAHMYITPLITIFTKIKKYEGILDNRRITSYRRLLIRGIDSEKERNYKKTQEEGLKFTKEEFEKSIEDNKKKLTDTEYLLLKLYTEIHARDDFGLLHITDEKKYNTDKNYFNRKTDEIILNNYKTSKTHGRKIYKLSRSLANFIHSSKKIAINSPDKLYLIEKNNHKMFGKGKLKELISRLLNNIFNKPPRPALYSINDIRKAYVSDVMNKKHTLEDRKELADNMMSSIDLQDLTYKRKDAEKKTKKEVKPERALDMIL